MNEDTATLQTLKLDNVGTMLAHRLSRWSTITPTLGERLLLADWTGLPGSS